MTATRSEFSHRPSLVLTNISLSLREVGFRLLQFISPLGAGPQAFNALVYVSHGSGLLSRFSSRRCGLVKAIADGAALLLEQAKERAAEGLIELLCGLLDLAFGDAVG